MAGNYSGDVGSYSHPQFTTQNQQIYSREGAAVSLTNFACFASRNKVLVNRVFVRALSTPSATAGTLCVNFIDTAGTEVTLKALTLSACSLGFITSLSFTAKTLETVTQYIGIDLTNNEKGKWLVIYDYQVLYPATYA